MGISLGFTEQKQIPIRNAWVAREQVRYYSTTANDWVPWTGGTGLTVRFSPYATGYDASGYAVTILGPYAMAEGSDAGWYSAAISGDVVTAALGSLVGQTIYQIAEAPYGSSLDLATSQPLLVIDPRPVVTIG